MSAPRRLGFVLALAVAAFVAPPPASGQCFGPDGLTFGPCCGPVPAILPGFPTTSMPGLGICWQQCTVTNTRTLKVSWPTPANVSCGQYTTPITIADGTSGMPMLAGVMRLDYTRTWTETDPAGMQIQVWRFTVKADLQLASTGAPPCPVPNCIAPGGFPTAFFYGYVDYATCAAGGPWQNALVLYHAADRFIHQPGLSNRPGVFHPTGAFAIVAPHSAVQPFLPMNTIAPGGPVIGEAVRDVTIPGVPPGLCIVEDRITQANIVKLGAGCVNTLSNVPKQQTSRQFQGATNCVTAAGTPAGWASLNVNFPVVPWFHMITTSIGTWTNGNVYPGKESAWVDEGLFVHQDACLGDFVELKYGGSTKDGWPVTLPIPVIVTNFTDIADNWSAPLAGPFVLPIMGTVMPTDRLIYVNMP